MKRILVVEDDPVNAHVLREFFGAYGYETVVARDGLQGVAAFERERPDLVVIDILLPFKNGYDVFDELRRSEAGKKTPVFLMSAVFDDLADVHEGRPKATRAQGYFSKPFDLHTLIDHVAFYLGELAMQRPAFLAELALPANRDKLWMSISSGYATAAAFAFLAGLGLVFHLVEVTTPLALLVLVKAATNTLALVALRKDRFVLDAGTLNVTADVVCMTGAIYYSGGMESPLFTIYAIEISVVALLTNLGTTLLVAGGCVALFGAMSLAIHTGALAAMPTPIQLAGRSTAYVAIMTAYAAFVLGVPTFYTAKILRLLREKERTLEAQAAALVEAGKQKSQFMANVTHELRTPIHGICGLSDLVESGIYGTVSDKQREAHQGIKRSARSLLALIDDLLELARSDAGKTSYVASDVDLAELLPTTLATVKWLAGTKELRVALEVDGSLPTIRTDRAKLNQVLVNLLANAVKFTPEGGSITLRAHAAGERVIFEVADTGIGIPRAEQARVFDEFQQVDGSSERAYGGVGLGLALVKRLAAILGGTVSVSSSEGAGSTFRVEIPVRYSVVGLAA